MNESKKSPEDGFREALGDLIPLAAKLAPICKSTEELVAVCSLALENDAQLRILMMVCSKK